MVVLLASAEGCSPREACPGPGYHGRGIRHPRAQPKLGNAEAVPEPAYDKVPSDGRCATPESFSPAPPASGSTRGRQYGELHALPQSSQSPTAKNARQRRGVVPRTSRCSATGSTAWFRVSEGGNPALCG